ncbi:hypothetical protein L1987_88711 [Smallanthus sonchifolius]|nr:hypothetical protein L1987_88711 [Smallanthus sonchifolius]
MDILLESLTKKRKQKAYFRKEVQEEGLIPLPFTVPCDLYTDTPIYPKENQLKEERAPFPLLSLTKPPPVHSSTTDAENPIPSQAFLLSLTC